MSAMRNFEVVITLLLLLVSFTVADDDCEDGCRKVDLSKLWYVWLILIFICALLGCGFLGSCVKICCRSNKPHVPTFEAHPFEVTVIAMDNQSTIHSISTISSITVSHPPQSGHSFAGLVNGSSAPPPYNLYALESPPLYDEALAMPANAGYPGPGFGGECHLHPSAAREEVTWVTEEHPERDDRLGDAPDLTATYEEDPPAYQLYGTIEEEELSEVELEEPDPTQSHAPDAKSPGENA
ncbi:hypothetical protein MATL_G00112610 [Megalops atlanticus]|uniref:Transmembrane protein 52 n=1 Tax=Megalops atlanticus TaxID=7932 RepID=A0A9D3Q3D4_MEGAT|nr:hypothetical protein MATL_G00112610 [Megalops atlanticus]